MTTATKTRTVTEVDIQIVCACCGRPAEPVPGPCGHCFCQPCQGHVLKAADCPLCIEGLWTLPWEGWPK